MENLEEYKWIGKNYDYLLQKYRDMYVAVKGQRVIAHGKDRKLVLKEAEKTLEKPVIYFMTERLSWKELNEIFEDVPENAFIQGFRRAYKELGHL